MNAAAWVFRSAALSAALGFALACIQRGHVIPAALALTVSVVWIGLEWRRKNPPASLFLVGFTLANAWGASAALPAFWLILSQSAALAAWDLSAFLKRMRAVQRIENPTRLQNNHLLRLGLLLGSGFALAELTMVWQIRLSFWAAFALGGLLIFGLARLVGLLRSDGPRRP
jgi:hypothetical protein